MAVASVLALIFVFRPCSALRKVLWIRLGFGHFSMGATSLVGWKDPTGRREMERDVIVALSFSL